MNSYDTDVRDDAYEGRAIVAVFGSRDAAHGALHALHDEGFGKTWLGVTKASDTGYATSGTQVESADDGGTMAAIGRFFSGETGTKSLTDELRRHGVADATANRLEGSLPPGSCVLTVDGHNHPELAANIIERANGHIVAGEAFDEASAGTTFDDGALEATATTRLHAGGSAALGYGDPAASARGEAIDNERLIKLRSERLEINKQQVAAGQADVGVDVVTRRESVDVPTFHEEFFVESRPVAENVADDGTPIGSRDRITIPLMREDVAVTKRQVVTGEFAVGKRRVADVKNVSEELREERLDVADSSRLAGSDRSGV